VTYYSILVVCDGLKRDLKSLPLLLNGLLLLLLVLLLRLYHSCKSSKSLLYGGGIHGISID
jgi:hypothetical protein